MHSRYDVSIRSALLTVLAFALAAGPAQAAWLPDAYVGGFGLSTTTATHANPTAIADGAGGVIVVWQDQRNGVDYDIYAQRINARGDALWTANGVAVCSATNAQILPVVTSDGAGGAIIAWQDFRNGSHYDVFAQRVNANGTTAWTASGINVCNAAGIQEALAIISDDAGGAILTWQDLRSGGTNDIYALRVGPTGTSLWTANGRAVSVAGGSQLAPRLASDGANGAIISWHDLRGANYDIYAQRVPASGIPQWTADGVSVCNAAGNQTSSMIVSDYVGGAVITWDDARSGTSDIYAQRVGPNGTTLWVANGSAVCTATNAQVTPSIATDGSGGAIIAWTDWRAVATNSQDIYAQRVNAAGFTAWTSNGVPLHTTTTGAQIAPVCVSSDGLGGAIISWADSRSMLNYDAYAQRVGPNGTRYWNDEALVTGAVLDQYVIALVSDGAQGAYAVSIDNRNGVFKTYAQKLNASSSLGDCTPRIVSVRDVPNDQGSFVNLRFDRSRLDLQIDDNFQVDYTIWRQVPNAAALAALKGGARLLAAGERAERGGADRGLLRKTVEMNGVTYYWEQWDWVDGRGIPSYGAVLETTSDSLPSSNPRTLYMVEAQSYEDGDYWYYQSAPDSGYSVDNLPPGAPGSFAAQYAAGTTQLHWAPVVAPDFAGYRLYRGGTLTFTPGPGNLVQAVSDTGYTDAAGGPYVYKLTAVDLHGNESPIATVAPTGIVDAPPAGPAVFFLGAPVPNPARANLGVTLRFGLARPGEARVRVFDAQGRLVRTLESGPHAAGEHVARWDGRNDHHVPLAAGLYFVRLEAESRVATTRVTLLW
ncbi:MAG: T9SS type A sorting domain-containing protein [Candidatus Eisenbacteria bacterium]|uniref:T9SS type A sorting domain-containing protein n=1 Tax=Eiseniibacteriota bacterium TaxID=2212470 RepID=A0A849SK64_UNCEI|nr:T9SS type A sorting domain-containing protein [Candidatus Eisenbacteria bacterium]